MLTLAKDYLGDDVYVEFTAGMLKLTTQNGIEITNTILLESDVYVALLHYVERVRQKAAQENKT